MTDAQNKAIQSLERALKKVKASGLVLIGMDSELTAYSRHYLLRCGYYKRKDPNDAMRECIDDGFSTRVKDSGAYLDSGGW